VRPFAPESALELADWLRDRGSAGAGEAPAISGSHGREPAEGLEPAPRDLVSLARMADVEDLRPSDLTVTVDAGMRIDVLRELAREAGLWLAAPEGSADGSAGGWVAAAPVHPLENAVGPVRRQVLGCRLVLHDGRVTRWGRAVMKNVAGYDIPRLVCGSRGRLGVITSLTFRLWPAPRVERHIRVSGEGPSRFGEVFADPPPFDGWAWRETPGRERFTIDGLLTGGEKAVAARLADVDRWARSMRLDVESTEPEGEMGAPGEPTRGRAPSSAAYRVAFGRHYLASGLAQLRSRLSTVDGTYAVVAYPHAGVVRVSADGLLPANRRSAPAWLTALAEAGGTAAGRAAWLDVGPQVRVERGGAEEHAAARHLRPAAVRSVETRILEAFGGKEAPWQAEYV